MYLIGGYQKSIEDYSCLADTEIIPISKKVTRINCSIPSMKNARAIFGMCCFAGCIFVAGGCQKEPYLDKCEVYSFKSCKWTQVSSMNAKRCRFALIYFQYKIWAIGGYSNNTHLDTIETFDLAENKWTTINTKLLSKRGGHSAVVHNKKFYVIGGTNNDAEVVSSIEVYSSETNQFSFVKSMNFRRSNFGCCILSSKLYVIGGNLDSDCNKRTDEVEIYDIAKDVWEKGPSLPLKLAAIGCSSTEL